MRNAIACGDEIEHAVDGETYEISTRVPVRAAVYRSLVRHAKRGTTGLAFPSVETLAKQAGVSPRTVRRALRDLEALGLIEAPFGHSKGGRPLDRSAEKTQTTRYKIVRNPVTVTPLKPGHGDRRVLPTEGGPPSASASSGRRSASGTKSREELQRLIVERAALIGATVEHLNRWSITDLMTILDDINARLEAAPPSSAELSDNTPETDDIDN